MRLLALPTTLALFISLASAAYSPFREYSGTSFFDGFDFYGAIDNTTWGNVTYVNQANASSDNLAYVNPQGNAIIRVDNTTTVEGTGVLYRNSVRLTSKDPYSVGSLFVIDALHLPYGCSVWPSIWLNGILQPGQVWPAAGEIDLIEYINLMDNNQMALHSNPGCVQAANPAQSGKTLLTDCSTKTGCTVAETKPGSNGAAFAQANGGVYALQFDVSGIYMWFWPRANIPSSISTATSTSTMDLTDWGEPSAAYPASGCNITEFFPAQNLIIDITLCGEWAGIPSLYADTCPGNCVSSNILGTGNPVYNNAYFEIPYIRTYLASTSSSSSSSSSSGTSTSTGTKSAGTGTGASTGGTASTTQSSSSAESTRMMSGVSLVLASILALAAWGVVIP